MTIQCTLGIDIGSISANFALIDHEHRFIDSVYLRTCGSPVQALQRGFSALYEKPGRKLEIIGCGVTGSARDLIGYIVGADIVKNEITAHGLAALELYPEVRTVIEIGGQDSKIIIIRDGIIVDFGMNTVCAAGTGSFLDHQAFRLGIPIEEFGAIALEAKQISSIAGRCTVFAESDMIHKQQIGHAKADIIAGLCDALVRNFVNNVAKGKSIRSPVIFQGGVAANSGIQRAFERILGLPVFVPEHFNVMGAFGAALLAREYIEDHGQPSSFRGFSISDHAFTTRGFFCGQCPNNCEILEIAENDTIIAHTGDRCGQYSLPGKPTSSVRRTCEVEHCSQPLATGSVQHSPQHLSAVNDTESR